MFGKLVKYFLWTVTALAGLIVLLVLLLYFPPVQNFIRNQAASYLSRTRGMQLEAEKIRLSFPFRLTVDNASLITAEKDTLFRISKLETEIALLPLLRKEILIPRLSLKQAAADYRDTTSNFYLKAVLTGFELDESKVLLSEQSVGVAGALLSGARVDLTLGRSEAVDTTAPGGPVHWLIRAGELGLNDVEFRMHTSPEVTELVVSLGKGSVEKCSVDLGTQEVFARKVRLEKGNYSYLVDTAKITPPPAAALSDGQDKKPLSPPWTVRVDRVELNDNSAAYGNLYGVPVPGFDPDHIRVSELDMNIDSLYNRGAAVAVILRELVFRERSGLDIIAARGRFSMDSTDVRLTDFILRTPYSRIDAQASAGAGILSMDPLSPLSLRLKADLGGRDIFLFVPASQTVHQTLEKRNMTVRGDLTGHLNNIYVNLVRVDMPGHVALQVKGRLQSVTRPEKLGAEITLNGNFERLDFLKALLDTSMQNRLGFPERMTLGGRLKIAGDVYYPDLELAIDTARLGLKGQLGLKDEIYRADLSATDFPLELFLPRDSLGLLTFGLEASGKKFDPRAAGAEANLSLRLGRLDYNRYDYRNIALDAHLAGHLLEGRLTGDSEALQLDIGLEGEIRPEKYEAQLSGKVSALDLFGLHFVDSPLNASFVLNASALAMPDTVYRAALTIDSIILRHGGRTDPMRRTELQASADPRAVETSVRSGDLSLDFNAPVSLDSFLASAGRTSEQIARQIESARLDMDGIQSALPPFRFKLSMGPNNLVNGYLRGKGISFGQVTAEALTDGSAPFHAFVKVEELDTGTLTLDTLSAGLDRKGRSLDYYLRLANRPGNYEDMALIAVYGSADSNAVRTNFFQRNRSDSIGFRFGLDAELLDSAVRVSLFPEKMVFGYTDWSVNPQNFITYYYGSDAVEADMRMTAENQHAFILSDSLPGIPRSVRLDISGIDLGQVSGMFPGLPSVGGIVSTDVTLGRAGRLVATRGHIGVNGLAYNGHAVGDIGTDASFEAGATGRWELGTVLTIDGKPVLTAGGTYAVEQGDTLDFKVDIPAFPLAKANPFLPASAPRLDGNLHGNLTVGGPRPGLTSMAGSTLQKGKWTCR